MNKPLVDGKFHNEKFEKAAEIALQKTAYAKSFNQAQKMIEAAAEIVADVPALVERLAALEAKPPEVKVQVLPPKPAAVAKPQKKIGMRQTMAIAAAAHFRDFTDQVETRKTISEALPGLEYTEARKQVGAYLKSGVDTALTTDALGGSHLVSTDLMNEVLTDPATPSVFAALSARGSSIPFGGAKSITYPLMRDASNTGLRPQFVAEDATIPVGEGNVGSLTVQAYKMALICVVSNELKKVAITPLVSLIEDQIITQFGMALDEALLDGSAAVAGLRPASIVNGATNQASAGNSFAQVLTDLKWLINNATLSRFRDPVFVINPGQLTGLRLITDSNGAFVFRDELERGSLLGIPVIASNNVTADQFYIIDAAQFLSSTDVIGLDASQSASIVMLNNDGTDPTITGPDGVTVAGSVKVSDAAGVAGGPAETKSMLQHYSTALRFVAPLGWGMRTTGQTVFYLTGVGY